jgi:hypothetical protein
MSRHFASPWKPNIPSGYVVKDATGQAIAMSMDEFHVTRRRVTSPWESAHFIRKVLLRQIAILNYINPFRSECPLLALSRHFVRDELCPLMTHSGHQQSLTRYGQGHRKVTNTTSPSAATSRP